jgi:glycerol-3-phosphate dehydrogenase
VQTDRANILDHVRQRTEPWDVVVIGGGATGAGCAVDAASRGFDVLLLERHDFGKGTSSRSTKLVHGGVRYLAQGNISLVREALKERGILLKNAPHVVHKLAFVVPCYSLWQKLFYGTGLKIYDLLAGKYSFGKSRIISKTKTLEYLPNIKSKGLSGGVLYYDGQFDDARLLIDLVRTASAHSAAVLNYSRVTSLTKNIAGRIEHVVFEDVETGEAFTVFTKAVINATGAFCDDIRHMTDAERKSLVSFSQGIHLVFDRKFLPSDRALMIPKTRDGRVLFCIPWLGSLLVGTTDTPVERAELEPTALKSEIKFILGTVREYLSPAPTRDDILSIFAGIRPLVRSANSKNTASLSRGHTIEIDESGLVTVTGGKWTTYRRMAEDAVNQAIKVAELSKTPSTTADLEIAKPNSSEESVSEKVHPDLSYCKSDIIRAVREEYALTLEDVLARRTRVLFLNAQAAIEIAPKVAELMAGELGKDQDWISEQIHLFDQTAKAYSMHFDPKANREF